MQCPVCEDSKLAIAERQGIEIDYCPECRGVWLDRGELDKIIERTNEEHERNEETSDREHEGPGLGDLVGKDKKSHGKKRKRKSLLNELLDF